MTRLTLLWYAMNASAVASGVASLCTKWVDGRTGRLYRRTADVVLGVVLIVCGLLMAGLVWSVGGFRS